MADYFALLTRTITALGCKGPDDRRVVYDRARQALTDHLQAREPPMSDLAIRTEQALLETAIRRAETVAARNDPPELRPPPPRAEAPSVGAPGAPIDEPATEAAGLDSLLESSRLQLSRPLMAVIAASVVALVALAAYALWPRSTREAARPPASRVETPRAPAATPAPGEQAAAAKSDPGAADGLSYVYRRQPVYYRTTSPVGTVIVDKSQRLLYLVQPNVSALRYGIGVGRGCLDVAGLLRVTRKEEPSAGAKALGARVIYLGNETQLIHGTDAAKSIGGSVPQGCFLLVNDAVIDLFDRINVGAGVVVTD